MNHARAPRRQPRQQAGVLFLVLGMVLAGVVLTIPSAQASGQPYSEFTFTFENGITYSGDTIGLNSMNAPFPYVEGAFLHVSCSATFDDGWNSNGEFPNPVDNPDWQISSYFITRYRASGEFHLSCGETFTDPDPEPVTVNVTVGYCEWDGEQSLTPINVSIAPAGAATVSVAGQDFTSDGSVNAPPGSYDWAATAMPGYELTGPSSGTVVAPDCSPCGCEEPEPVTVVVMLGACIWDGEQSLTPINVSIDPAGAARVMVAGLAFTSDGSVDVGPGSYDWTATARPGYELVGDSSGTVVAVDCAPEAEPVAVAIVAGECTWDGQASITDVEINIDPAGGAIVTLNGESISGSGGTVSLTPGTYDWAAIAEPGYELTGSSSGTVVAVDCEVPPSLVEVAVTPGECVWTGTEALADVDFVINPAGGATILLTGPSGSQMIDADTTVSVGPGEHMWVATAVDPYELAGEASGSFTVADCEPPLGALGDYVWLDQNLDGVQDADELPVAGVVVELLVDGGVVSTTSTNDEGLYLFPNLGAGDYQVQFTAPENYMFVDGLQGSDGALDSDVVDITDVDGLQVGTTDEVALALGDVDLTIDAGLFFVDVQTQVPEPEPKTPPETPTEPETPSVTETPDGPTAAATPDTQVLGIQVLPDTGFTQEGWAAFALSLMMMGVGIVLLSGGKESELGEDAALA